MKRCEEYFSRRVKYKSSGLGLGFGTWDVMYIWSLGLGLGFWGTGCSISLVFWRKSRMVDVATMSEEE